MDHLVAELLEAVLEIFGEFLVEMVFELATESLRALFKARAQTSPASAALWLTCAGAAAGLLSAWLFPHRLIATRIVVPGLSLVLTPLATGLAMHFVGERLRRAQRYASNLATFRGGAVFAFSMAVTRWWLI